MACENCSNLIVEKSALEKDFNQLQTHLNEKISIFNINLTDADDTNRALAEENEFFRAELDRVLALNQKLQEQSNEDQKKISNLVHQNQQLETALNARDQESDQQNSDHKQTIGDLKIENSKFEEEIDRLRTENKELTSCLKLLRRSKEDAEKKFELQKIELADHYDRVNSDLIVLQESLQRYKTEHSDLKDDLDFTENENRSMTKKLADLTAQNNDLMKSRDRYKRLNSDKNSLIKKLKASDKKLSVVKFRKENASLKSALANERRDRKMIDKLFKEDQFNLKMNPTKFAVREEVKSVPSIQAYDDLLKSMKSL